MKTIAFFSYKGGAGRSTLAYNIIPILAEEYYKPTADCPIIVVDMDIDSCGMSYLLEVETAVTDKNNVQYLLGNGCDKVRVRNIKDHPFLKNLIPVGNAYGYEDNDAILLLPAKDGLNIRENTTSNYSDGGSPLTRSFQSFLDVCDNFFDIPLVIIDSAVGNQATANVSIEVSDSIVCCMKPTIQFVNGTKRYLCGLEGIKYDNEKSDEAEKLRNISLGKNIIVVPNVVPQNPLTINGLEYPGFAVENVKRDFKKFFKDEERNHNYYFDMLEGEIFGIPAIERFMWREDRLYKNTSLTDFEKTVLGRYKKLAQLIYDINEE